MNPYIEIIRPGNAIMSAIVIILVAIIDRSFNLPIFLAMLAVFFETAAGNVINDYFDYNIDLINKYYGSTGWFQDKEMYENNILPKVKAGVLGEDTIWNMNDDINNLILEMQSIVNDYLKNRC